MTERNDFIAHYRKPVNTHSDEELIVRHIMHEDLPDEMLSPKIKEKIQRVWLCQQLREKYLTRLKVLPKLMEEYSISEATARRIYDLTTKCHGKTKPAERAFYVDMLLGEIRETKAFAKKINDPRAMAQCDRNFKETIRDLIPDIDIPPYEELQPVDIIIGFFPELTGITLPANYKQQIEQLKRKKSMKKLDIQDAEILPPDDSDEPQN
jgi:hypothetical protein